MSTHHYDAFVDVGVLTHVEVARLVAGQHCMDMVSARQRHPFQTSRGRGERDGRIYHRQDPIRPIEAMVGKSHEKRFDGCLVHETDQFRIGLREFSFHVVRTFVQRLLCLRRKLLAHLRAASKRRIHYDDAGVSRGVHRVF